MMHARHASRKFSLWKWRNLYFAKHHAGSNSTFRKFVSFVKNDRPLLRSSTRWPLVQLCGKPVFFSSIPTVLLPPIVFTSLLITLWLYKCLMMVIFQNKIIYMPSVPPFSRSEKVADYENSCKPAIWTEESIKSLDGTRLALCVGKVKTIGRVVNVPTQRKRIHVLILYFQGNASSLPPRLPLLSRILKSQQLIEDNIKCTLVALSYRGFWKSSGRASQAGIEKDALSTLSWISDFYVSIDATHFVVWGQSIGAGVACFTAVRVQEVTSKIGNALKLDGLILETPFKSIRSMLISLYPQKWLPYRYLGPFLRNWWDNEMELRSLSEQSTRPEIFIVDAANDEVVPAAHGKELFQLCNDCLLKARHATIKSALHTEILFRPEGRAKIVEFLRDVSRR